MKDELMSRILELETDAVRAQEFEASYHLLMAALHIAAVAGDREGLDGIAERARQRAGAVEAVRPPHRLSRLRAQERGQTALFDSLMIHVEAAKARTRTALA